jgi:hypothetical protein
VLKLRRSAIFDDWPTVLSELTVPNPKAMTTTPVTTNAGRLDHREAHDQAISDADFVTPPLGEAAQMRNPLLSDLCREHWAKPVPPKSDGLMADVDPALGPAPSHVPPHAPRPPRRSVPDMASRHRGLSPNWAFQSSRGQSQFA